MPEETAIRIRNLLEASFAIAKGKKSPTKSGTNVAAAPLAKFARTLGIRESRPK